MLGKCMASIHNLAYVLVLQSAGREITRHPVIQHVVKHYQACAYLLQEAFDLRLLKSSWHGVKQASQIMGTVLKYQKDTACPHERNCY